jgi:hypothetical protein
MSSARNLFRLLRSLEEFIRIYDTLSHKQLRMTMNLILKLGKRISLFFYYFFQNMKLMVNYKAIRGDADLYQKTASTFFLIYEIFAISSCV